MATRCQIWPICIQPFPQPVPMVVHQHPCKPLAALKANGIVPAPDSESFGDSPGVELPDMRSWGRCMAASLAPSPRPSHSQPPCSAPRIWEGSTLVMVISATPQNPPLCFPLIHPNSACIPKQFSFPPGVLREPCPGSSWTSGSESESMSPRKASHPASYLCQELVLPKHPFFLVLLFF